MAFSAQWTKEGIDTKNENVSKQDQKKKQKSTIWRLKSQ